MSLNPGKGRFMVSTLGECDKLDIVVDLVKAKAIEEEEIDLKNSIEKSKTLVSKIPTRFNNRAERQAASIDLFPDSQIKVPDPEPSCKYECFPGSGCISVFHDLMKTKYIEMINFHREEMLDYIKKDLERQGKILNLLDEISSWTKENYRLEQENVKLRKIIIDKESF